MTIWYTVLLNKDGYPVKYLDPLTGAVQTHRGPYADPGEASQEFCAQMSSTAQCCYLEQHAFRQKVRLHYIQSPLFPL